MADIYLQCISCKMLWVVTYCSPSSWSKVKEFKSNSTDLYYGFCQTCNNMSKESKQSAIEKYRSVYKSLDMPAGLSDPEQIDIYYKVVRYRDNGKIHVYPEEFQDLEQAKIKMNQSATGKYFGHCKVFVYKVFKGTGRADIVRETGER